MRIFLVLNIFIFVLGACSEDEVITSTRNLLRPGALAFACIGETKDGKQTGYPMSQCYVPEDDVDCKTERCGTLYGLVTNTGRGDVALFETEKSPEPLIDMDKGSPGYGFIPVGRNPRDIQTTKDSCRAYTANAGSCSLSVIDIPAAIRLANNSYDGPSGAIVSELVIHNDLGPLNAKPDSIAISPVGMPQANVDQTCDPQQEYRAYVSFPRCNYVAEVDLRSGKILQGILIKADAYEQTTTPICPLECDANAQPVGLDAAFNDAGVQRDTSVSDLGDTPDSNGLADANVEAGANATDGPAFDSGPANDSANTAIDAGVDQKSNDASSSSSDASDAISAEVYVDGVLPGHMILDPDSFRLYIASGGANFISVIDLDTQGVFQNPRALKLSGERTQTTRLALSPQTKTLGKFLYAVTKDHSVRVISVELEQECQANIDLLQLNEEVDLNQARCFSADNSQILQRPVDRDSTPGIYFPNRLPIDISFAQIDRDPDDEVKIGDDIEATPLVGTFAFITTSDGNIFVIDVEDETRISSTSTTISRFHLPHQPRNSIQGSDEDDYQVSAEVSRIFGKDEGGVPSIIESLGGKELGIAIRAFGYTINKYPSLIYEPILVERNYGRLNVEEGALYLEDEGAAFCEHAIVGEKKENARVIQHGDIVEFVGCTDDSDCALGYRCERVVGQESEYGLCLDASRQTELLSQCSSYLRGKREFLAKEAFNHKLVLDVLPVEPQRIIKQDNMDGLCSTNDDCEDGFYCALADRLVDSDSEGVYSISKGTCFRSGCRKDSDCTSGYCRQPYRDAALTTNCSDKNARCVCVVSPLPIEKGNICQNDADCEATSVGNTCYFDRDCDANAECRALEVEGVKTCQDRNYRCVSGATGEKRCTRPSPCFNNDQHIYVRSGRSFIVGYSRTKNGRQFVVAEKHRIIADSERGECKKDEALSSLIENRIPIYLPIYPVISGPICEHRVGELPSPNGCIRVYDESYQGFIARGSAEGEVSVNWGPRGVGTENEAPISAIEFANSYMQFSLGVGHLAALPQTLAGLAKTAPMPEMGMSINLTIENGYRRFSTTQSGSIALPNRLYYGPDHRLYLVDIGDQSSYSGTTRGQVLRWLAKDLSFEVFQVK